MRSSLFKITGGTLYDPANGIDGAVRDLWIDGARIVVPPSDPAARPERTLDAAGLVVMPGGVDMHCHIAGPKVNAARRMLSAADRPSLLRADESGAGALGSTPTTFITGHRYAGLGYTTAFDAAIAPLTARHAHLELADTPCIDKGCFILIGNNQYLLEAIRDGEPQRVKGLIAWLLGAAKGFAPKLVNPGGVAAWKAGRNAPLADLDEKLAGFDISPRQIIAAIAQAAAELRLPHPLHIHANNLGMPGNWSTTLETMRSLEGRSAHLAHIQFHSYGGRPEEPTTFCSQVEPLADYFNSQANLSLDVGQVVFGRTTSMTADSAVGHFLSRLHGRQWYSHDIECETGCGIVPIEYKNKNLINAWQWAIGLEWFLLARDPWRIALSTDHPNGGSFLAYPRIIRFLMDRGSRVDALRAVHPVVRERSLLSHLDREYTLGEICIITRAAPARLLGLAHKGHLAPGADADITIYAPDDDIERMFQLPRHVIKAGEVIVEYGELRREVFGKTLHVEPDFDAALVPHIGRWFDEHYSIRFRNYAVADAYLGEHATIACGEPR
ncbi:MAG TPA: formylmethanofuran dehydrogenase subunit A [Pirellulales bacterium]|jgi:formylmethanofuran dehydrogenase subunit A|nr:formylmethanofuran dehydrogenase subunit A [Pirellulales bacterium]